MIQSGTTLDHEWYHFAMAMNLRLRPDQEKALRAESKRTGISQQELVRSSIDRLLGIDEKGPYDDLRALDDLAVVPIDDRVIESARIIGPPVLRFLDAIHLTTATLTGARELWTYDDRLATASIEMGIPARMPGRD